MVKNVQKKKYLCRYRTCFLIGIVILSAHILLLANFFASNKLLTENPDQWESSDSGNRDDTGSNLLVSRNDDEETNLLAPQIKRSYNNNATIQFRLDDLNFQLPCHINEKQALSALSRAKTQHCKHLIANISCLTLEQGRLYPITLQSSCPTGNFIRGKQMGCYKDEKNFRLLNGYLTVDKIYNSPEFCINLCLQSGFPYAGIEYSEECFCGSEEPSRGSKIPDSSCNMKCPADPHSTCGGYYTINIYQTGIKKFIPKIANDDSTMTSEDESVKLLFLLTLNGRPLRQVKRLLKILYHQNHYYYIHVDVRQDYLFRELLFLEQFPNIRLTRQRFATIWGGASLLEMLRSCMLELLHMESWNWDFILNLSESDFPVKPIDKLTRFLSANRNKNFVKSHGREVQRFIQKQGLDKIFIECEYRMWRIGNRRLPFGIQIDGGSDWIALSRPFVEYVANPAPDNLVSGLLSVFKHTLLPAESFFHTVLRNSKFCNTYVDNNLHVTNWKRKLGCKCQYKHVVDWCGCSPNDFRLDDWSKILNTQSRPIYFARKFEPIISQLVILQLELWLFNLDKSAKQVKNLNSYWQNMYHHYDMGVSPDEALHILANSIARKTMKLYNLSNKTLACPIGSIDKLLQVHSFHYNDNYKSTLFHYATTSKRDIEVAIRPRDKLIVATRKHQLNEYLISISISTDFDQKEQTSRNFLRLISPYSDIFLIYKFNPFKSVKQYNFTCLWIDPIGNLLDFSIFSVDDTTLVGMVKANLKAPHLPGIWRAKLIYKDNAVIAEVPFLIIPLPQLSLVLLNAIKLNSDNLNENDAIEQYTEFLPSPNERAILEKNVIENLQHQNDSLHEWIDTLTDGFFSIQRICLNTKDGISVCDSSVNSCHLTRWSSMAPDPKSAIDRYNNVNKSTGMFDVW